MGPDRLRKTVRLGDVPQRAAESVKLRIEHLLASATTGSPLDDETGRWVANLDDAMVEKLAAVDLVPKRQSTQLGAFLEAYIVARCDTKPNTRIVYGHTERNLVEYFGANKALREISPGVADHWRLNLVKQGLADNTVRRRCGIAKQFFRAAIHGSSPCFRSWFPTFRMCLTPPSRGRNT